MLRTDASKIILERRMVIIITPPHAGPHRSAFMNCDFYDSTQVLDAYFGPKGAEYTVGRIPMGSCDFSVDQYSFDDVPGDYNLTHFDTGVTKDTVQRVSHIPLTQGRWASFKAY